jgi:DNA invertase Pin-like site-specific DNA recombinase
MMARCVLVQYYSVIKPRTAVMSQLAAALHEWHLKNHKFIAYVRAERQIEIDEQCDEIESYAKEHHLTITETFCDLGEPMTGLHHALEAVENVDGIIITNVDRLVSHHDNRLRDLRPVLHRFCSASENKHLISIEEGINTATPLGQMNAMELVTELKDAV